MRTLLLTLALAACTPAAPPSDQTAGDAGEAQSANANAAALSATPQPGVWSFNADEGTFAAGFGAPESEYLLNIVCESPTGKITLIYEHELAPDQDTRLRIITAGQTLDLAARSFNEGLPSITAEVLDSAAEKTALVSMLGAPMERFGVETGGEIGVFPWDDEISETLDACR